jgi:hypothetical protein
LRARGGNALGLAACAQGQHLPQRLLTLADVAAVALLLAAAAVTRARGSRPSRRPEPPPQRR